jgi:NAD-dependent dihydropyrimidine dehydrogenase PreA subunit
MPVLINFKICDNSKDCNGIAVCPTHTIVWDEKNKAIKIDNSKCINCGKCEESCPVSAIRVAKDEKEYKKIKKEIDEDPRKVSDLLVDRYGAVSISPAFLIPLDKFEVQILESNKPAVVELFKNSSIKCLLYSIPIKELFKNLDVKYRKINIGNDETLLKKYKINQVPALLFFNNGKLIGKIEGHYRIGNLSELKKKVEDITKLIK